MHLFKFKNVIFGTRITALEAQGGQRPDYVDIVHALYEQFPWPRKTVSIRVVQFGHSSYFLRSLKTWRTSRRMK